MRVLHVVATAQRRGAEIFASDLVRGLGTAELDQLVVVLDGEGPRGVTFDARTIALAGGAHAPWTAQPRAISSLRRLTDRWRPDVIQAHGGEALVYATLARARPVVYRKIGGAHPRFARQPYRTAYGALLRRADRIIAVAEAMRREVVDLFGVSPSRVRTVPHGVDVRRIAPTRSRAAMREQLGIAPGARVVTSLGALTWEKDPVTALAAIAPVLQERSDAVHLFVGDGPLREQVRRAARERGLSDRARLLGVRDDVGDVLASTDVLLLSSRIEGMPGCIVEAGMLGVPSAAFAVAGVPEIVSHGETGLLAEPGDTKRLGDLVATLLDDDGLRAQLGDAARADFTKRFEIGNVAPRYLETYREVAGALGSNTRLTTGKRGGTA